jgi:hypothetical protein
MNDSRVGAKKAVTDTKVAEYEKWRKKYLYFHELDMHLEFRQAKKKNKSLVKKKLEIEGFEHNFKIADVIQKWIKDDSEIVNDLDETNRYKWLTSFQVNFKPVNGTTRKRKMKATGFL